MAGKTLLSILFEQDSKEQVDVKDVEAGKLQGSTSALETALKGIGLEGDSFRKIQKAILRYRQVGEVAKLTIAEKEAMALVFAAMIKTPDDAKLNTVFSALKNLEGK